MVLIFYVITPLLGSRRAFRLPGKVQAPLRGRNCPGCRSGFWVPGDSVPAAGGP